MDKRWRPVTGWEEFYRVSELGEVVSLPRVTRQGYFAGGPLTPWLVAGYPVVRLSGGQGRRKIRAVHLLVLEAFSGPRPPGQEARHLDGVRAHCWLSNLAWGTHSENEMDKIQHGTGRQGEQHPLARLTAIQVQDIRSRYAAGGVSQRALASMFGVGQMQISRIVRGERWARERIPT